MTFKKSKRVGLLAFSVKRMIIIIYTICVLKWLLLLLFSFRWSVCRQDSLLLQVWRSCQTWWVFKHFSGWWNKNLTYCDTHTLKCFIHHNWSGYFWSVRVYCEYYARCCSGRFSLLEYGHMMACCESCFLCLVQHDVKVCKRVASFFWIHLEKASKKKKTGAALVKKIEHSLAQHGAHF